MNVNLLSLRALLTSIVGWHSIFGLICLHATPQDWIGDRSSRHSYICVPRCLFQMSFLFVSLTRCKIWVCVHFDWQYKEFRMRAFRDIETQQFWRCCGLTISFRFGFPIILLPRLLSFDFITSSHFPIPPNCVLFNSLFAHARREKKRKE